MAAGNHEQPFRRCDTEDTVQLLVQHLNREGIDVLNVEQLNSTGRDCVFLAMMHGVRPDARQNARRMVKDRDDGGRALDMEAVTVAQMRGMLADHIVNIWDNQNSWARGAMHIHVNHEARGYLGLSAEADASTVRDAYCAAIRGTDPHQPMYGDTGCMLAFASRFQATVLCWMPPRQAQQAQRQRNRLFRPLLFGSAETAREGGETANRVACMMLLYIMTDGVGHAKPLRARTSREGRPGRFTGASVHRKYALA